MRLNKTSILIILTLFLSGCLTEFVEKDDINKPADSVKDDVMEMRDDSSITPEDLNTLPVTVPLIIFSYNILSYYALVEYPAPAKLLLAVPTPVTSLDTTAVLLTKFFI